MKIIHVSDIHLGSRLTAKFNRNISKEIKNNIKLTFSNIITYAKDNGIKVILIAGDLFENNNPSSSDINYFKSLVLANSEIDFIYLRGNHDLDNEVLNLPNLKLFNNDNIISYRYNNVVISGIEIDNNNINSYYSMLNLNSNYFNILMLHGEINKEILINKLVNSNINYLALGHIHSYKCGLIGSNTTYAYSGCIEPRGFDETGDKGFVLLDINNNNLTYNFIPISQKTFRELEININDSDNLEDIINNILKENINNNDIYRINLVGELSYNNNINDNIDYIYSRIKDMFYYVEIKNHTKVKINYEDYINDLSIKGEFVRNVLNNNLYSEEEKHNIIMLGLITYEGGNN